MLPDKGFLHKSVVYEGGTHMVEEIQLLENPEPIKTLLLSSKEVRKTRVVTLNSSETDHLG